MSADAEAERARDHTLLLDAVRAAGDIAHAFFGRAQTSWDKHSGDPVSEADLAVDVYLAQALRRARPGYGWLSEESSAVPSRDAHERTWIVDPIDGTRAFLRGRAEFTISVALVESGRPVCAAVFNPATGELYDARVGAGTRLNGAAVRTTRRTGLTGATVLAGHGETKRAGWQDRFGTSEIGRLGSIAYKLARVAAGQADATVSLSAKADWDLAGGDLLVTEAGGCVSTRAGAPLCYGTRAARHASVIAAGAALHAEILTHLAAVAP